MTTLAITTTGLTRERRWGALGLIAAAWLVLQYFWYCPCM